MRPLAHQPIKRGRVTEMPRLSEAHGVVAMIIGQYGQDVARPEPSTRSRRRDRRSFWRGAAAI